MEWILAIILLPFGILLLILLFRYTDNTKIKIHNRRKKQREEKEEEKYLRKLEIKKLEQETKKGKE